MDRSQARAKLFAVVGAQLSKVKFDTLPLHPGRIRHATIAAGRNTDHGPKAEDQSREQRAQIL